jgi:titin
MELVMLHYSNQTYSNSYGANQLLPNQFVIPAPPGGSLNPYGGIQTSISFIVQPCGIPTGLSGISYQSGQVFLSWYSPSDNGGSPISNYLIQYSTTGSAPWSQVYTGSANIYYTITGLINGVTYYFQIAAINGYCNNGTGYGPLSGLFSTTTNATPATTPDQVSNVQTTSGPNVGYISVTWSAPGNGGLAISSYTLQYRISGSGSFTTISGIPSTSYNVTGLLNSTTYEFQVAALNSIGFGPYSSIVIGSTFTTPNSPTNLTGTSGNAQVSLTWAAPTNNGGTPITQYSVGYSSSSSSGPFTSVNTGSTATTYIVTGLTNGTLYYIRVSGITAVGTGTPSSVISLTPSTIPGPAIITSSVSCDNQQVLVTWASTSPPVDTGGAPILSYNLQYTTSLTGPITWLPTPAPYSVTAPTTSYTFTGLTNGTPYYFQVRAINLNGAGPYSAQTAQSTAIPSVTPQPPIPITTTAITSSSIALSWTAPTGLANTGGNPVTGYLIYWSQLSSTGSVISTNSTTISGAPPATTYTITGLTYATLYQIQISSISCSGVGPISSPALYITTSSIPPSAPTNVAISGCNTGYTNSVILTWTAPANDGGSPITNYVIYYRTTSPVGIWYTYNTNSSATTDIITLPSSGVSYDFKVAAQNSAGVGTFSSPIINSSSYNPPSAPSRLATTNIVSNTSSNGAIFLSWTASTQEAPQTISYYVIEYKICEFGGWITYPTTIPSPTTSTTLSNLSTSNIANNVPYLFRVYAVNSCGARSESSGLTTATSYNNSEPTRLWSRFQSNCSGNITSFDTLTRNMLRKGQVLQYPAVGNLQYSRAALWSMAAKNQLTRQKAWASQSQDYTYPNITNINNQVGVGLRQTPTSLVCWTPPPTLICNQTSDSNVPGKPTTLCISKNAPFDNFRHPITYASGGSKFPVFFSK